MASRMSPASLQSDLPLNSKPWVEALTGGEAAAETTAHSHWVSPVPTNPAVRPGIRPVADSGNPIQEEIKCANPTRTN
jgi:hypothetical protein